MDISFKIATENQQHTASGSPSSNTPGRNVTRRDLTKPSTTIREIQRMIYHPYWPRVMLTRIKTKPQSTPSSTHSSQSEDKSDNERDTIFRPPEIDNGLNNPPGESHNKKECRLCSKRTFNVKKNEKKDLISIIKDPSSHIVYEDEQGECIYQEKCSICENFHDKYDCPDVNWRRIEVDGGYTIWSNIHPDKGTGRRKPGEKLPPEYKSKMFCRECETSISDSSSYHG